MLRKYLLLFNTYTLRHPSDWDNTFKLNTPCKNGLKLLSGAIGDDFSINLSLSSENTKDYRRHQGPSFSPAFYKARSEKALINFKFTRQR
jgi:hypothetical protein